MVLYYGLIKIGNRTNIHENFIKKHNTKQFLNVLN